MFFLEPLDCKLGVFVCYLLVVLSLSNCASLSEKNQTLVREYQMALAAYSSFDSMDCDLEVELTQPAKARYQQMFSDSAAADEVLKDSLSFKWLARENTCTIETFDKSEVYKAQKLVLENVFCLLLQTHFVNSPFDELVVRTEDLVDKKDFVQIPAFEQSEAGVYVKKLNPKSKPKEKIFEFETRTRGKGNFKARYRPRSNGPGIALEAVEHRHKNVILVVDQLIFNAESVSAKSAKREQIESLWVSMGSEAPYALAQVKVKNCR